jgi:membrane associated rhomboid family serine protease
MGIYDRDYIRREPPTRPMYARGGVAAMRMWSANTWLILICVAVFVIDPFLPGRWDVFDFAVNTSNIEPEQFAQIDPSQLIVEPQVVVTHRLPGGQPVLGYRSVVFRGVEVAHQRVRRMQLLQSWLYFSTARALIYFPSTGGIQGFEFWRFFGFQFLHAHLPHLLFNMLALFFFGPMVERYLGSKRYVAFYLLCGMFGALMYMLLNLGGILASSSIPGLLFNDPATPLVGASAGVFGVLMAGAYMAPNATVLLFFFLPMRLRTLAYALVVIAFITVFRGGANAGGEAGHLGGALAGFYFIRRPHHLHGFFDILGRLDPTSHHYRGKKRRGGVGRPLKDTAHLDRILAKIGTQGLQSLTEKEKRILREASEK